jgi:hypothetical protein
LIKEIIGFVIMLVMCVGIIFMIPSFTVYTSAIGNDNLHDPSSGVLYEAHNITVNQTSVIANENSAFIMVYFALVFALILLAVGVYVKGMR